MPDQIIDRFVFDELSTNTGADFVQELVETFAEEAPGLLAQMWDAQSTGAADPFRRAAHSLKSNALTFGAVRLGELARDLEQGGLPAPGHSLMHLRDALDEAVQALKVLSRA